MNYIEYHVSPFHNGDSERSYAVVFKTTEYWQAVAMCVTDQTDNVYVIYVQDPNMHVAADSVWRNGQKKWERSQ